MVYRLVASDTIEEKVMALKEKKAELFERVVEGTSAEAVDGASGGPEAATPVAGTRRTALTAAEIRELIAP